MCILLMIILESACQEIADIGGFRVRHWSMKQAVKIN